MDIGIFSGSFNPIHIGHLALANWLCEFVDLSEIWFLVTPLSPLKSELEMLDYATRLELVSLSIADYNRFRVSDFERSLPAPWYTIDTLRSLRAAYGGNRFHLIIGADSWCQFDQWKESEALLKEFPVLVYPRLGFDYVERPVPVGGSVHRVDAPILEISSSFIRSSLRAGHDVRFFLPEPIRGHFSIANNKQ